MNRARSTGRNWPGIPGLVARHGPGTLARLRRKGRLASGIASESVPAYYFGRAPSQLLSSSFQRPPRSRQLSIVSSCDIHKPATIATTAIAPAIDNRAFPLEVIAISGAASSAPPPSSYGRSSSSRARLPRSIACRGWPRRVGGIARLRAMRRFQVGVSICSRSNRTRKTTAVRKAYPHGIETLMTLVRAAVQAPHHIQSELTFTSLTVPRLSTHSRRRYTKLNVNLSFSPLFNTYVR